MARPIDASLALALFALAPAASPTTAAQSNQDAPILVGTLGGVFSTLWAVNNDNAAVGWSDVTWTDSEHAILWQDGQLIDLGALPGDTVSRALGINDLGQVVGLSVNTDGLSRLVRPALWEHGQAIELPFGEGCVATAINNDGHIAVRCGGPAWIWRDGRRVDIGLLPGYHSSDIRALNAAGVAVGSMFDGRGGSTAFRWEKGVLTDLGAALPGARSSAAMAINARGQIAGTVLWNTAPVRAEPVIWEADGVRPVAGTWGIFYGEARGINNRGDVVGGGSFVDGSGDGAFVASRGTFRFYDPYLLLQDINEEGTAVGRYSPSGWAAEGVLIPKANAQVRAALTPAP